MEPAMSFVKLHSHGHAQLINTDHVKTVILRTFSDGNGKAYESPTLVYIDGEELILDGDLYSAWTVLEGGWSPAHTVR
jgi:hypothetical protein